MIDTILIIEDESPNSDRLIRQINNIFPKLTIKVLESVVESIEWLNSNAHPSVILSDVRLSDGLCFEIFEQVKVECPIVFTTAYDEYAIKAFKVNGIDYLLKPIDQDELKTALEKVESFALKQQSVPLDSLIQCLKPVEYKNRFLLPLLDGYKTVEVSDIVYIYSELKISKAMLQSGALETIPYTLEEIEKQLNPKLFFRANRQYIIHIGSIQFVHHYFNGKLKITIKRHTDTEIIVSRDKAAFFKKWLDS